jgi:iron-sulfur cluster assembly protein
VADLARDQRSDDTVFEQQGVKIFVDADSLALVDGTEIDFGKQGLSEAFLFRNPNATAECGCGESFTTAADRA